MSVFSGVAQAEAIRSSGNTAADAQREATALQGRMYDESIARNKPFYDVGVSNLSDFQRMLRGGYNMQESPAAKWQIEQGTKGMNRALASRGLSGSGTAVNRLTELNKGVAGADWNNQYNRILDALKLGTGASASMGMAGNTLGNQSQLGASNLGDIFQNQGNNQASLYGNMSGNTTQGVGVGLKIADYYNKPSPIVDQGLIT